MLDFACVIITSAECTTTKGARGSVVRRTTNGTRLVSALGRNSSESSPPISSLSSSSLPSVAFVPTLHKTSAMAQHHGTANTHIEQSSVDWELLEGGHWQWKVFPSLLSCRLLSLPTDYPTPLCRWRRRAVHSFVRHWHLAGSLSHSPAQKANSCLGIGSILESGYPCALGSYSVYSLPLLDYDLY